MTTSKKRPVWQKVAEGYYGESFGQTKRSEIDAAADAWDGGLPGGDFYLHHFLFLNLQAQAGLHEQNARIIALLEGMQAPEDEADEETEEVQRLEGEE